MKALLIYLALCGCIFVGAQVLYFSTYISLLSFAALVAALSLLMPCIRPFDKDVVDLFYYTAAIVAAVLLFMYKSPEREQTAIGSQILEELSKQEQVENDTLLIEEVLLGASSMTETDRQNGWIQR